jgi:hypothetical protein
MSTATTGDDREGTDGSGRTEDGLVGRVVHYETGDELTLFPAAANDVSLMSRWLTADEGSWVELAEMR